MKVYILIEQVFSQCESPYFEVLGTYKNKEDAQKEQSKTIKDNIENFEFVEDEENTNNIFAIKRIFLKFQENWNNYIEYKIIESEVSI